MKKLTTEEFIEKVKIVHDNEYGYPLVNYQGSKIKVKITCKKHGIFEQTPNMHIKGQGCPKCAIKLITKKLSIDTKRFIKKVRKVHDNKYNYPKTEYVNNKTKVKINCTEHGEFEQRPDMHIRGQGCPDCRKEKLRKLYKSNNKEFIKCSNITHNNFYTYPLVNYVNSYTKVKITCPIHGIFEQRPKDHIHNKQGCPICKEFKGEKEIRLYLENNNIKFKTQKTFDDCKYKRLLLFDFYLPKHNLCIEYDGIQHFKPIEYFGGEKGFNKRQINDNIKNDFCKNNNINLLRIKYNENIQESIKILVK